MSQFDILTWESRMLFSCLLRRTGENFASFALLEDFVGLKIKTLKDTNQQRKIVLCAN